MPHKQVAQALLRGALVGVGRIGARAAARAYGSVLADVSSVARQINQKLAEAEKKLRDLTDDGWDDDRPDIRR